MMELFRKFCGAAICALALAGCQTAAPPAPPATSLQRPAPGAPRDFGLTSAASSPIAAPAAPSGQRIAAAPTNILKSSYSLWIPIATENPHGDPALLAEARAMGREARDIAAGLTAARERRGDAHAAMLVDAHLALGNGRASMSWLLRTILMDGSHLLAIANSDFLWHMSENALRSPQANGDPLFRADAENTRDIARALTLYGAALALIDGTKCADATARYERTAQILRTRGFRFHGIEALPAEKRAAIRDAVLALETETQAARRPDPTICRQGIQHIKRAMDAAPYANMNIFGPEFARLGQVDANGVLNVPLPAVPDAPDMFRPRAAYADDMIAVRRHDVPDLLHAMLP